MTGRSRLIRLRALHWATVDVLTSLEDAGYTCKEIIDRDWVEGRPKAKKQLKDLMSDLREDMDEVNASMKKLREIYPWKEEQ